MDAKAMFQFSYGVYLLTTEQSGKVNGCIVNTGCQVTGDPVRVAVTVNKENLTCEMMSASGHFALMPLNEDADMPFIGLFGFRSGRTEDKLAQLPYEKDALGDPILPAHPFIGAVISCRVVSTLDVGTHILFVGEVVDAQVTGAQGAPMTYAYYHKVRKGLTPPKASSYIPGARDAEKAEQKTETKKIKRWRCKVCGYECEGENPPETCPVCGVGAEEFELIEG